MITDGKKWHYLALKSKHGHDGKNGIIIPQKVFQNYLDKLHEIIMEILLFWLLKFISYNKSALKNAKDCVIITITVT